jgi:hypothetical protein
MTAKGKNEKPHTTWSPAAASDRKNNDYTFIQRNTAYRRFPILRVFDFVARSNVSSTSFSSKTWLKQLWMNHRFSPVIKSWSSSLLSNACGNRPMDQVTRKEESKAFVAIRSQSNWRWYQLSNEWKSTALMGDAKDEKYPDSIAQ